MNSDVFQRQRYPLLIVISGPSGVGKDTVLESMRRRRLPFHFVVTATSRPQRPGEVDGEDYFFVSREQFEAMVEHGELIEHALVYNQYKGIPKQQVLDALASGQDVIMRIDVQGAATVRRLYPEALLIFLTTRSAEELVGRLKSRETETPESLRLRLTTARQELEQWGLFDYLVVNADGQLDEAVDTISAIIQAEHHRTRPRRVTL